MKFKLVNQKQCKQNFSSLQGYINITHDELSRVFGKPDPIQCSDGKVTTEWIIEFADKTIATIYDWKRYELGAPKKDELYEWHIGGHSRKAAELVMGEVAAYRSISVMIGQL